jgi:hypothetical protein
LSNQWCGGQVENKMALKTKKSEYILYNPLT